MGALPRVNINCAKCILAHKCPTSVLPGGAPTHGRDLATHKNFRTGQILQREGEKAGALRFIKVGLLGVHKLGLDGVERLLAVIGPGFMLGQQTLHARPAFVSVRALTDVAACEFRADSLRRRVLEFDQHSPGLGTFTNQSFITITNWSHVSRVPNLRTRLAMALQLIASVQPAGLVRVPSQALLAQLLAVTRESVNRTWRDFETAGIVKRQGRQYMDIDIAALSLVLTTQE